MGVSMKCSWRMSWLCCRARGCGEVPCECYAVGGSGHGALAILLDHVAEGNLLDPRPLEATSQENVGRAEAIAEQVAPARAYPGRHRLEVVAEVLARGLDCLGRIAVDLAQSQVPPHDVERSRIQLRQHEVTPLM